MDENCRKLYPLFIDLAGRRCLVVGAGKVARRKVSSLLDCGAGVVVIAPDVTEFSQPVEMHQREFCEDDLKGAFFVVAATNDASLNHRIANLARQRGCLVNDVDSGELSNALVPATFRRGDHVAVAVSTSGASPLLAKHLRDLIASVISEEHGKAAEVLASLRDEWKPTEEELRALLQRLSNVE